MSSAAARKNQWGLIQFREVAINSTTFQPDKKWVTINALLDVYRAQKAYKAVTGRYTEKKDQLHLPPYTLSKRCIRDLDIKLDWGGFRVTARPAEEFLEDGHTRTDRFVWFGEEKENFF
nr:hypothetical protein BaRGS_012441 [Batillaria attramentaria]